MPQVRSRTVRFDGENYVRKTTVDKDGVFKIIIPTTAREILGIKEVTADTVEKVERLWMKKIEEYKTAKTTTRKVIHYRFENNSSIMGPDSKDPDDQICIYSSSDISFCNGVAIALSAGVFIEAETVYSDGKKTYRYEEVESTFPSSMHGSHTDFGPSVRYREDSLKSMIDWTPEREAFFKQMGEAIEQLILKMDGVMNDKKKLLEIADSGRHAITFSK